MSFKVSGNKLEMGLPNKHAVSKFVEPTKAFLLKETILFDSRLRYSNLTVSLNSPASIWVILMLYKSKYLREANPLNVFTSKAVNWLLYKDILKRSQAVKSVGIYDC